MVEWAFLSQIVDKLGFSEDWINLIKQCISTTSCAILVNGSPSSFFKPKRGIHLEYHVSPYLLIICMESLSRVVMDAEAKS